MPKLTKSLVDAIRATDRDTFTWDSALRGFALRTSPSGTKTFIVQYRTPAGRTRRYALGQYGRITPDEARRLAQDALGRVARGEDPSAERRNERRAATVDALMTNWLEHHAPKLSASYVNHNRALYTRYVLRPLGPKPVDAVTRDDCQALHRGLRSTPVQANRLLSLLHRLFELAVVDGLRAGNPTRGISKYPETPRNDYVPSAKIEALSAALDAHPDRDAARALLLLLLTGARPSEVLRAKPEMFDLDAGVWVKPSSHTKQRREHRLPLSRAACEVLRAQFEAHPGSAWLFPSPRKPGQPRENIRRAWAQVAQQAGLSGTRRYGLRHTHASLLVAAGHGLPLIGAALGHTQVATTRRYTHLEDSALRAAVEGVAGLTGPKK